MHMKVHERSLVKLPNLCSDGDKLMSHHATVPKIFQCGHCSISFPTNSRLKRHTLIHTREKVHQCQQCNKSLSAKGYLDMHMKVHKKSLVKAQNLCLRSNKLMSCDVSIPKLLQSFTISSHLKRHTLIHTREKVHQCQQCNKSFSRKGYLNLHMKVHGRPPLKCRYCGKFCSAYHLLKIHERIHTGEKPYRCQHCSKSFATSSQLIDHNRMHTGVKPYRCQHCSKSHTTGYKLKIHSMAVHQNLL